MSTAIRSSLTLALVSLGLTAGDLRAQDPLLDQPPAGTSSGCADLQCDYYDSSFVLAEDFVLEDERTVVEMTFWGGYFDDQVYDDVFTVWIHEDVAGVPATPAIYSESAVSSARAPTGLTVPFSGSPVDEYRFTLRLSAPVTLAAGIYWIAIANDSTGQEGDFVLEFGAVDLDHGRAGSAVSTTGAVWFANVTNFGLQIPDVLLFIDGFEAGDTLAWSAVQP